MCEPYRCSRHSNSHICDYYTNQAAYGLPVYMGSRHQKGHGFFSSLFRFTIPLLKRGGIGLAKHLLKTGSNIVSDVEAGKSLKQSAQDRFIETGTNVVGTLTGQRGSTLK